MGKDTNINLGGQAMTALKRLVMGLFSKSK